MELDVVLLECGIVVHLQAVQKLDEDRIDAHVNLTEQAEGIAGFHTHRTSRIVETFEKGRLKLR